MLKIASDRSQLCREPCSAAIYLLFPTPWKGSVTTSPSTDEGCPEGPEAHGWILTQAWLTLGCGQGFCLSYKEPTDLEGQTSVLGRVDYRGSLLLWGAPSSFLKPGETPNQERPQTL